MLWTATSIIPPRNTRWKCEVCKYGIWKSWYSIWGISPYEEKESRQYPRRSDHPQVRRYWMLVLPFYPRYEQVYGNDGSLWRKAFRGCGWKDQALSQVWTRWLCGSEANAQGEDRQMVSMESGVAFICFLWSRYVFSFTHFHSLPFTWSVPLRETRFGLRCNRSIASPTFLRS